jgi:signal-transduction protein with cAMP-binding, CBS, and nucleotidyltransferase domain
MGIQGFEDLCTNTTVKMKGCKGLSSNPAAMRCDYCKEKYDRIYAKAKKGALKFKPKIEARRLSVSLMSDVVGTTAGKLQREWTSRVEHIYATMYARALRRAFPPVFALCLCGSLARREACPFSDIDSFLLVENSTEKDTEYFRRVGKEVKQCLLEMGGDVDGFQLCRGGLDPINIIETPEDLLNEITQIEISDPGSHLLGIRDSPSFMFGQPKLFERFQNLIAAAKSQDLAGRKDTALKNLQRLVKPGGAFVLPTLKDEAVNIKEQLYRPVQLLLRDLSAYFGLQGTDGRTQVLELTKSNAMSPSIANYTINILEDVGKLRIQNHLRAKKENDFLLLDKKRAREGDVVATVKDLQQITACLERLERLKRLTERFINEYALQQKSSAGQFLARKPKNPFTGDVSTLV